MAYVEQHFPDDGLALPIGEIVSRREIDWDNVEQELPRLLQQRQPPIQNISSDRALDTIEAFFGRELLTMHPTTGYFTFNDAVLNP